ncbi:ATP-binding protein [Zhaonella formicivorans]|uniref:ATP-binding protein n=1 Tax=Zhaonella formicivorans TaxID=2528593 RepID=UPI0010EEDDCE|nr:ATP-binding protein [Zhaonella formicivorans]
MQDFSKADFTLLAGRLTLFRRILNDEAVQAMLDLTRQSAENDKLTAYSRLFFTLALAAEQDEHFLADGWKNHLLNLILWDENPFSRQAGGWARKISSGVKNAALHDLQCLHRLYHWKFPGREGLGLEVPGWEALLGPALPKRRAVCLDFRQKFERPKLSPEDLNQCLELLSAHYAREGIGIFGRYRVLRWDGEQKQLIGVSAPDPIGLSDLIGYERERAQVLENTEIFLAGLPANNVLLYGDRGTGKSSTVKALVNSCGSRGLRLLEVTKQDLADLPLILRHIKDYALYFILFIDDLSFEDYEVEYKALKAVLEGGVEVRPKNVLIYATSNRRNLVRESFKERQQDEVHPADTMQEKLSLGDRFGLTVTFIAPDQKQYLKIVEGLAQKRGLSVSLPELQRQAIQWELRHSGRSGRVARQFVDYLEGKLRGETIKTGEGQH